MKARLKKRYAEVKIQKQVEKGNEIHVEVNKKILRCKSKFKGRICFNFLVEVGKKKSHFFHLKGFIIIVIIFTVTSPLQKKVFSTFLYLRQILEYCITLRQKLFNLIPPPHPQSTLTYTVYELPFCPYFGFSRLSSRIQQNMLPNTGQKELQ